MLVLLSINICLTGLGVANEEMLARLSIIESPSTIESGTGVNVIGGQAQSTDSYASDNPNYVSVAPKSKESYTSFDTALGLVYGLTFGYSAIFVLLGLPTLIVFLLVSIIGVIQLFCLFYMTAYFIGIFRGASI
jgi:hypothetical protein